MFRHGREHGVFGNYECSIELGAEFAEGWQKKGDESEHEGLECSAMQEDHFGRITRRDRNFLTY